MDHLSAAGSSATRNLTTTEPSESLNRRKTVDFRFQRPHATSRSFFFNKPMRAMDSRRDFTSKKVFSGYFSELGEKANSALLILFSFFVAFFFLFLVGGGGQYQCAECYYRAVRCGEEDEGKERERERRAIEERGIALAIIKDLRYAKMRPAYRNR